MDEPCSAPPAAVALAPRVAVAVPRDPESLRPLDRVAELAVALLGADAGRVLPVPRVGSPDALSPDALSTGAGGLSAGVDRVLADLVDALLRETAATGADSAVDDTAADPRSRELLAPLLAGRLEDAGIGAHLTAAVVDDTGRVLGALGVVSAAPRGWTPADADLLRELAGSALVELRLEALSGELAAERVRWDLATAAAGVGGFDWDLATGVLVADEHLPRLFDGTSTDGRAPGEARGFDGTAASLAARLHPDDLPAVTASLTAAVRRCDGFQVEFRVLTPAGGVRWLQARGRCLPGEDGAAARVLGAAHDSTDRHEDEARLGRVLETMSAAFLSLDRGRRVASANREAERLLGAPRADLVGRPLPAVLAGSAGRALDALCREAAAAGAPRTASVRHVGAGGGEVWFEARAWPGADGVALHLVDTTDRRRAQLAAEQASTRLTMLAEVTAELSGTLDAATAVAQLTRLLVPELADWCVITLVDDAGRPEDVGWWHRDPALRPVLARYTELRMRSLTAASRLTRVLRTGRRAVLTDAGRVAAAEGLVEGEALNLLRVLAPGAAALLPLRARGRTLGLLSVYTDPGSGHHARGHLVAAEEVALRAGLALDNARLYDQQRRMAEGLQRSLLTDPPEVEGVEIVVRYVPAAEAAKVGGDWYDAFRQVGGELVLVIGDVVGHDTEAAAAMGQLRGLLRGIAHHSGASPAQVLTGLDAAMAGLHVGTTATAVVARLEPRSADPDEPAGARGVVLRWSSAGHPPALVVDRSGWVTALTGWEADVLLGVDPAAARSEAVARLAPGATVLLYTDGLVERRGTSLDDGLEQLRAVVADLARHPLDELCDAVLARMLPGRAEDDVALIALRLDDA